MEKLQIRQIGCLQKLFFHIITKTQLINLIVPNLLKYVHFCHITFLKYPLLEKVSFESLQNLQNKPKTHNPNPHKNLKCENLKHKVRKISTYNERLVFRYASCRLPR